MKIQKREISVLFSHLDHIRPGPDPKPLYLDSSNLDGIIPERLNILYNTVWDLWKDLCENKKKGDFSAFFASRPHWTRSYLKPYKSKNVWFLWPVRLIKAIVSLYKCNYGSELESFRACHSSRSYQCKAICTLVIIVFSMSKKV